MKRLLKRGLQTATLFSTASQLRLSFHKQRAVKRLVGIGGRQYRDIGNEFDAARIYFSPTPEGQGYFCALLRQTPYQYLDIGCGQFRLRQSLRPLGLCLPRLIGLRLKTALLFLQSSLLVIRQKFRLLFLKFFFR
jgi:hypothetical protein